MHIAVEWIRKWRVHTRGGIKLSLVDSNQGRSKEIRMDETGFVAGSGNWVYSETEDGIEMSKTTNRELKILLPFLSIFDTTNRRLQNDR